MSLLRLIRYIINEVINKNFRLQSFLCEHDAPTRQILLTSVYFSLPMRKKFSTVSLRQTRKYINFATFHVCLWQIDLKTLEIAFQSLEMEHSFKKWMLILVLLCENERQRWDAPRYIKARSCYQNTVTDYSVSIQWIDVTSIIIIVWRH